MSYLAASTYEAIRQDPAMVTAYYYSVHDQFVSDLGMPELSEDVLKAAWCSVVAYGLAEYGPQPTTNDLTSLLLSPTLACNGYVTVTWRLLEEFGISTLKQVAVGWDGGAIGNHAQMLVLDSSSNVLLDPTIGLVVDGVTMDGLVSGVHYQNMHSFYDYERADLQSFNQKVKNAVAEGLYLPNDAIYYVPGEDNWLYHYDEYLLPRAVTTYDETSQYDWSSIVSNYDWAERRTSVQYNENDATHVQYLYDPLGKYNWLAIDSYFDQNWRCESALYHEDDGTRVKYQYDVDSECAWDSLVTYFDQLWQRAEVIYHEDDGGDVAYQYDLTDQESWACVETYFTTDSRRTEVIYHEDDGTSVAYQYDLADNHGWSTAVTIYDMSNHVENFITY
jgi:hypothetical protein